MQTELRALLLASSAVSDLVSDRVDWGVLRQGARRSAIVLHLIGHRQGVTQQGPDGLWRGRVQVDCIGADYVDAVAVAAAVTALLHGYSGGGFQLILLADQRDDYETEAQGRPFRISLDFLTNWSETNGGN